MRTPSGKLIVEFAEDEIAFLNVLNTILPVAVPDFRRAVRRAVVEAAHIIPFDAFGVVRAGRTATEITLYTVGGLSSALLATLRADLERAGVPAGGGPGPTSDSEVEVVELPGPARAPTRRNRGRSTWRRPSRRRRAPARSSPWREMRSSAASRALDAGHLAALVPGLQRGLPKMEDVGHDPLTGCYNRRKFVDESGASWRQARRYG